MLNNKSKKARFAGAKAALLRLAKAVGGLYVSGIGIMIYTGTFSTVSFIATALAGVSFAALIYTAVRLDD